MGARVTPFLEKNNCTRQEIDRVAERFARELQPGEVVAFYGELGSGKTYFIKKLCRALETEQEATSPSFTIINEYHTRKGELIYHFDFYRLESEAELQNLDLDDFFYNDFICLVEWADKIRAYLPERRWEVYLDFVPHQPERRNLKIVRVENS